MLRALMLVWSMLSAAAFAANSDVTRETEGYGATQQEAVTNALVEAVRQVRGSAAGVDRGVKETLNVVAGAGGAVVEKTTQPVQDVYTTSRGYVRSYQVLEQRATDKGVYVRIRAVVPTFESAVSDQGKKRVAVLPFRVDADNWKLADHGKPDAFAQRLAGRITTQFTKEDKIVVVNRDYFAELGLEKAVLTADAAPEELTKLGASVGADFLLVGRIHEARTETKEGAYGAKGKTTDKIRLDWRLIEAATGKIAHAGDLSVDVVRKNRDAWWRKDKEDFEQGELFAALAQRIVDAAMEREPAPAALKPDWENPASELTPGSSALPLNYR